MSHRYYTDFYFLFYFNWGGGGVVLKNKNELPNPFPTLSVWFTKSYQNLEQESRLGKTPCKSFKTLEAMSGLRHTSKSWRESKEHMLLLVAALIKMVFLPLALRHRKKIKL